MGKENKCVSKMHCTKVLECYLLIQCTFTCTLYMHCRLKQRNNFLRHFLYGGGVVRGYNEHEILCGK